MIYENWHVQKGKLGGVPFKFNYENLSYLISPKGQMLVASPHNPQFPLTHEFPFCCRIYFIYQLTVSKLFRISLICYWYAYVLDSIKIHLLWNYTYVWLILLILFKYEQLSNFGTCKFFLSISCNYLFHLKLYLLVILYLINL